MTDPEKEIEELLAAPDAVKKNATELRKFHARKAAQRQEEERILASKSGEIPSLEDLLADIVRTAGDRLTNPMGYRLKQIGERRYKQFGHYPIEFLHKRCGQFSHALEMVELRDQPGTRLKKFARAAASRRAHSNRYLERYIKPYVIDDALTKRTLTGEVCILSIADTHATYLHPFVWQAFLRAIKDLQLGSDDIVLLNGDTLEGSEISRFPKVPGQTIELQVELDNQWHMCKQIRETGFDGHLIINPGNHGLDRWANYLTQVAPALANLRTLRIDQLMGLEEFNVTLAQGGSHMSPAGEEDDKSGLLLFDFYRVHHGVRLGQNPAMMELKDAGRSGQSAHVHRAAVAYGTTERDMVLCWMVLPMGCTPLAGRSYMKGTNYGWQMGFGVCFLGPNESVHQHPCVLSNGRIHVEGYVYEDQGLELPDPTTLWLPDLPIL